MCTMARGAAPPRAAGQRRPLTATGRGGEAEREGNPATDQSRLQATALDADTGCRLGMLLSLCGDIP
jgi:hypothetical protein